MKLMVRDSDNYILGVGVIDTPFDGCRLVPLEERHIGPLRQRGVKTLREDGTIAVAVPQEALDEDARLDGERTRRASIEGQVDGAIAQLETQRDLLISRAPTAAETRQILLLLCRVCLGLVRLLRNRV